MPLTELLSSFMETKTTRRATNRDELSLVKAAAWAWYQHGSGRSEKKPEGEFDLTTRRNRVVNRKPSRYRVEAMRIAEEEALSVQTHDHNKSLLDGFEVESISRRLDQLCGDPKLFEDDDDVQNMSLKSGSNGTLKKKKKTEKVMRRGFWAKRFGGVVCGTTHHDVVNSKRVPRRRHS